LILDEKIVKEDPREEKALQNKKNEKEEREIQAKQELEEIQKKRATLYNQTEKGECSTSSISGKKKKIILGQTKEKKAAPTKDKEKERTYEQKFLSKEKEDTSKNNDIVKENKLYPRVEEIITVWDIPYYVSRSQVFFAIKHLGRVKNIEMIREKSGKTRAEVSFERGSICVQEIEAWVIPLTNELLVRITPGSNRKEILESRKQFIAKVYNIPQNVNEVLLFRQLKYTGIRAVHIFKNSNGNNKGYALVSFRNQQEMS
jgi:hypothetical protein